MEIFNLALKHVIQGMIQGSVVIEKLNIKYLDTYKK